MLKVLVAEDDRLNQLVAAGALRRLRCEFEIVDSGTKAIVACLHDTFDAVLMDVMMPEVDGYEATARIRAAEATSGLQRTPIIGLSARAMEGDREIAILSGMDDYITKPLREADLRAALERWVVSRPEPVLDRRLARGVTSVR